MNSASGVRTPAGGLFTGEHHVLYTRGLHLLLPISYYCTACLCCSSHILPLALFLAGIMLTLIFYQLSQC